MSTAPSPPAPPQLITKPITVIHIWFRRRRIPAILALALSSHSHPPPPLVCMQIREPTDDWKLPIFPCNNRVVAAFKKVPLHKLKIPIVVFQVNESANS